jgi:hypothetical protein
MMIFIFIVVSYRYLKEAMVFLKETTSAGIHALKGILLNGDLEKSNRNTKYFVIGFFCKS